MQTAVQVNITMPNVPSSLAKVGDRLRAAEVNISAISCTEGKSTTVIHLILDDVETGKLVLKELGAVSITDVVAFKLKNKPGMIAAIGRECAAAQINIGNIYATTCGKEAMVYITVPDPKEAVRRLKDWEKRAGKLE